MNKQLLISLVFFTFTFLANAQVAVEKKQSDLELLNSISSESVYLHTNTTMLLVGEYLYYSVYNFETEEKAFSDLSKIAFVELIDSNGEKVFQQTIELKDGRGTGDYFIPTNIPSGNYKLVAYTSWMKNNKAYTYFDQNLVIINPYQSGQEQILSDTEKDSVSEIKISEKDSFGFELNNEDLKLSLNKEQYTTREKVELELNNMNNESNIYYSVSVRKIEEIGQPTLVSASSYHDQIFQQIRTSNFSNLDSIYLPDLRGEILSGQIIPDSENTNNDLGNIKVALSIPGEQFFLRIANTDDNGIFYFNIDQSFAVNKAKIQILNSNFNNYEIKLDQNSSFDYQTSEFSNFKINSSMKSLILERSVHNQIENAFYAKKPDTIKSLESRSLFDDLESIDYNLDDYTRFKTVQETFVEILDYARLRKTGDNTYEVAVLGLKPYENYNGTPLLIIDGLLVQDASDFVESYDSRKIDNIKIIRDKFFLGSKSYKGIIIIETFEKDYIENYQPDYIKDIVFKSIETPKNYFKQVYDSGEDYKDIPDFRYQLIWEPNGIIQQSSEKISFYTSDLSGRFEIVIQGFTNEVKPVTIRKTFRVE